MAKGQKIKSLWENIGINAAAPGIIGKLLLLSNLSWVDAHNPCSCVGLYLGRRSEHSQSVGRFHAPFLLPWDHHGIVHTEPTPAPETEHHRSTDYVLCIRGLIDVTTIRRGLVLLRPRFISPVTRFQHIIQHLPGGSDPLFITIIPALHPQHCSGIPPFRMR